MSTIITSPIDERDFTADKFLDSNTVLPQSYVAPSTEVRFQWFSYQCVCFAVTSAMSQQEALKNEGIYLLYSPTMLYANRDNLKDETEGWYVRAALKQLYKYGTVKNEDFNFTNSYKKARAEYKKHENYLLTKAQSHKIKAYFRCYTEEEIKRCIMQKGAVIMSCSWYSKCPAILQYHFKGNVDKSKMRGGHAMMIIGWTENNQWIIQDSYSMFRPIGGRILMDFSYPIDEYWGIEL